jgi:IMP dehydrogenase/GMP reductase
LETEIGIGRKARRAYGLDEIALVPAPVAVDPDDVDVSLKIGDLTLSIPVLASAMDAAVDTKVAIEMSRLGGLAVLNLEGLHVRYEDPTLSLNGLSAHQKKKRFKSCKKFTENLSSLS